MSSPLPSLSTLQSGITCALRWTALALPIAIVAQGFLGTPALGDEAPATDSATDSATETLTLNLDRAEAALAAADLLDQIAAELRGATPPALEASPTPADPLLPLLLPPDLRLAPAPEADLEPEQQDD